MKDKQFELMKNLYEQALTREDERKNAYDQKATNLVGFLGASVGIFLGTLVPVLLEKDFLADAVLTGLTLSVWSSAMALLIAGLIIFTILISRWKSMISSVPYMYPDPSSLLNLDEYDTKTIYLQDLNNSIQHNQNKINELGTQYNKIITLVKSILICFLLAILLLIACKFLITESKTIIHCPCFSINENNADGSQAICRLTAPLDRKEEKS